MGRPDDELHASGACCGACEHGAEVEAGRFVDTPSPELTAGPASQLVIVAHVNGLERRFPVLKDRVTIGRSPQSDVCLKEDHALSRLTCEVAIASDGSVNLRDLGSSCGTWLSAKKIGGQQVRVREKDTIIVGTSRLRIVREPR